VKKLSAIVWMLLIIAVPAFGQISSGELTGHGGWQWSHDGGTSGTSTGSSYYAISSPSLGGTARQFTISYWNHGGEIYHLSFGNDAVATHFIYDTYVYITNPSQVANLELDMNQVLSNGQTVILGTQCSVYSGTWEYTYVSSGHPHWHTSNLSCNPKSWSANAWHHIQIATHRNSSGVVTHDWVAIDGNKRYFSNAVGFSGLNLGWARGDLLINLQFDGASSSSGYIKAYIDKLFIQRW
jgi:hypothetical protein